MAHEFLHHLDVLAVRLQERRVRVPEGMETHPFCDPGPLCSGL
jgi:hypothetical protein